MVSGLLCRTASFAASMSRIIQSASPKTTSMFTSGICSNSNKRGFLANAPGSNSVESACSPLGGAAENRYVYSEMRDPCCEWSSPGRSSVLLPKRLRTILSTILREKGPAPRMIWFGFMPLFQRANTTFLMTDDSESMAGASGNPTGEASTRFSIYLSPPRIAKKQERYPPRLCATRSILSIFRASSHCVNEVRKKSKACSSSVAVQRGLSDAPQPSQSIAITLRLLFRAISAKFPAKSRAAAA
mmetsp:Transcript_3480/g.5982  ORF Transcript_3480/g.5982 Transcript_3480/m.5982 type:complete len:244 (-) Transcript_3480:601-1332(-)